MMRHLLNKFVLGILALTVSATAYSQGWESIDTPVSTNLILYDISFPAGQDEIGFTGGSNFTYNGKGKILKTEDLGETWEVIWESDVTGTGVMSIYFHTTMLGFAGNMDGDLMKTTDGGETWTITDIDASSDQGEIKDLNFYDNNNGALITSWNGIYITEDGGDTWTIASTNYLGAHDLAYGDANNLYACGGEQNIYKSTDGGDTWSFSYQGSNGGMQWFNLGVHFADANNGAVTSEEGQIFITSDGGDTWTSNTVTGQYGLMNGVYMYDADNIYVCATPGEVFLSNDGGSSWTSEYYDFDPSFYKIMFTNNGTGFVCGSGATGGNILKHDPTGLSILEYSNLEWGIYPNPASDQITLSYDLDSPAVIEVKLVDAQGRIVLNNSIQSQSGKNTKMLDIQQFPEGQYLLSLNNGKKVLGVKKIQILN